MGYVWGNPIHQSTDLINLFGLKRVMVFDTTLDFHLTKTFDKNIVGLGYSTYVGNEVKGYVIGEQTYTYLNTYDTKNKAYYVLVGRQFKRFAICGKLGLYTEAEYNNYLENGGNPNNVYYSKINGETQVQFGGQLIWTPNKLSGFSVGYDIFNGVVVGISIVI